MGQEGRFVALQLQRARKSVYQRGTVACRKCGKPIRVFKLAALADEFSVRCSACGERGLYKRRAVIIDELPERRKKPRA
jgi:DNA-directed RNA polymerase subunit RPC12/RpoP